MYRIVFLFLLILIVQVPVFAQEAAESGNTSEQGTSTQDVQNPAMHCDTAMKTFQAHAGTSSNEDMVVELGAAPNNQQPQQTTIKNSYICTKLLEPIPFSVLNRGDFCVTSIWSVEDSIGKEKRYMIIKGGGAGTISVDGRSIPTNTLGCSMIGVPSGMGAIERYIAIVYRWATMIMGVLAVIIMVIGGIMMSMEGANPDMKGSGKKLIQSAIIAMILLFLSGAILQMINPVFFT